MKLRKTSLVYYSMGLTIRESAEKPLNRQSQSCVDIVLPHINSTPMFYSYAAAVRLLVWHERDGQ